ncbi:PH domain-containing protein [Aquibacillus sediminis]|uniref:PH domain-containing protein n=1 Tax=Aquibacillus sediminis TaxID=2574734 RepID=UPI001FE5D5F7|nr:PH domain-containing protein [Aquibacillus sediminis]
MSNPKRLHPAAMIFTVISSLRQFIVAALPLIILSIGEGPFIYGVIGVAVFSILLIGYGILSWFRFTYVLEEDQIRIEQGVLIRKKRSISKSRIQSIDLTQGVIHRIFGLTKVQIETAGSDRDVDASLSAVTFDEGKYLHEQLKQVNEPNIKQQQNVNQPEDPSIFPSRSISVKRLIIAGSTSGSFGVILSLFVVFFSELESVIPATVYQEVTGWIVVQAIEILVGLAIMVLLFLWGIGILGTVIKYGQFTITRYEKELYITRGLLEKRQMTIPLKRIQAVGVKQSLVRQPLGYTTVFVEIAGGVQDNNKNTETLLFPLLRKSEVVAFLQEILPEYEQVPTDFIQVPKRALPYYLLRTAFVPLVAVIVVAVLGLEWIWIPLVILAIACSLGFARFQTAGFHLSEQQLTLQMRLFSKETIFVKQRRVQSLEIKQHILHRKQQLANVSPSILNNFGGKHYLVQELNQSDVERIADWYSYQKD